MINRQPMPVRRPENGKWHVIRQAGQAGQYLTATILQFDWRLAIAIGVLNDGELAIRRWCSTRACCDELIGGLLCIESAGSTVGRQGADLCRHRCIKGQACRNQHDTRHRGRKRHGRGRRIGFDTAFSRILSSMTLTSSNSFGTHPIAAVTEAGKVMLPSASMTTS